MSKSLKKLVEESREKNQPEVDMSDRGISNMLDVNGLFSLAHITQLVLSHNKLTTVPPNIAELKNLEVLNFFNNQIEELPTQISSLQKLKHLNLGMNRLNTLPRGFGSLPALEVLDLTYNNLNENSLPGNFFYLTTLRALYLSDNDFEILPPDIGKLTKLQILSLRDNDLISLPKEIGELTQLKELHIQGNRLTVLPPELGNLDLTGQKQVFKAENNPWVTPIADQFQLGVSHVFEYIRSETYKYCHPKLRIRKLCPFLWDEIAKLELLEMAWGNSSRQTTSLVDGLCVYPLRYETQANVYCVLGTVSGTILKESQKVWISIM
ncbi:ras suppressor protein 1 isoform X1 [Callorhinus ursinus]|uniref:Ras suppressor protein 1 n=2 Tax=Callorhinus ursinus TaxID=34884 RepID=A0A3Q7MPY1_CALUR|nr:ras suppressor protein 1 isoform X1 [Callorhinus ursinus]XP_027969893.1 ras suppressor protein 1 isoform X1 [Eumetopias jubatus]